METSRRLLRKIDLCHKGKDIDNLSNARKKHHIWSTHNKGLSHIFKTLRSNPEKFLGPYDRRWHLEAPRKGFSILGIVSDRLRC